MSERTIAEGIVNRWIAAFRDDPTGKNARERLADVIHAAIEQQLAAKDAEIARLRELLSNRLPHQLENMAALAETPAQSDREKFLAKYDGLCPCCQNNLKVENDKGIVDCPYCVTRELSSKCV